MSGRLTYYFSADREPEALFAEADLVADALMDLEDEDSTVTDGTVSVDAGLGLVTVEVYVMSEDPAQGEALGLRRVADALSRAGIPNDNSDVSHPRHVMEYA